VPGAPSPESVWTFAGGFADGTAAERLVVLNPNDETVTAVVQVVPYGAAAPEVLPEPFELDVPARRYALVDLDEESRVPAQGLHSVVVESDGGAVVAARLTYVSGAPPEPVADTPAEGDPAAPTPVEEPAAAERGGPEPNPLRAQLTRGTAGSLGSPLAARTWVSGGIRGSAAVFLVHNPSDGIAVVEVATGGGAAPSATLEVPPGDSVALAAATLEPPPEESWSVRFSAQVPVFVDRLLAWPTPGDLALQPAVPVLESLADLREGR